MQVVLLHSKWDPTIRAEVKKGFQEKIWGDLNPYESIFLPLARIIATNPVRKASGSGKGAWDSVISTHSKALPLFLEHILSSELLVLQKRSSRSEISLCLVREFVYLSESHHGQFVLLFSFWSQQRYKIAGKPSLYVNALSLSNVLCTHSHLGCRGWYNSWKSRKCWFPSFPWMSGLMPL